MLSNVHYFDGDYTHGEGLEFDLLHPKFGEKPVRYRLGFQKKISLTAAVRNPSNAPEETLWTIYDPKKGVRTEKLTAAELGALQEEMRSIKAQAAFPISLQKNASAHEPDKVTYSGFASNAGNKTMPMNTLFFNFQVTHPKSEHPSVTIVDLKFAPTTATGPLDCN